VREERQTQQRQLRARPVLRGVWSRACFKTSIGLGWVGPRSTPGLGGDDEEEEEVL
jgi:hypothetical protein